MLWKQSVEYVWPSCWKYKNTIEVFSFIPVFIASKEEKKSYLMKLFDNVNLMCKYFSTLSLNQKLAFFLNPSSPIKAWLRKTGPVYT